MPLATGTCGGCCLLCPKLTREPSCGGRMSVCPPHVPPQSRSHQSPHGDWCYRTWSEVPLARLEAGSLLLFKNQITVTTAKSCSFLPFGLVHFTPFCICIYVVTCYACYRKARNLRGCAWSWKTRWKTWRPSLLTRRTRKLSGMTWSEQRVWRRLITMETHWHYTCYCWQLLGVYFSREIIFYTFIDVVKG